MFEITPDPSQPNSVEQARHYFAQALWEADQSEVSNAQMGAIIAFPGVIIGRGRSHVTNPDEPLPALQTVAFPEDVALEEACRRMLPQAKRLDQASCFIADAGTRQLVLPQHHIATRLEEKGVGYVVVNYGRDLYRVPTTKVNSYSSVEKLLDFS